VQIRVSLKIAFDPEQPVIKQGVVLEKIIE